MKLAIWFIFIFCCNALQSQELFTYSEPASNMAAKSIAFRFSNSLMKRNSSGEYNYHFMPEIMWGASRKWLLHINGFLSNRNTQFNTEGGAIYFKYRFYSRDDVHSHFRMSAFLRSAINKSDIHQPAIDLNGHNSGYETGLISTKLVNRVAVSGGASFLYASDNSGNEKFIYGDKNRNAIAFNLSIGRLMLPKEYISYNQTNLNVMIEFPGQTNLSTGKSFIDMAPSLQLIIMSKMRVDLGYRFPLLNDLYRTASDGFLFRFEYNIFNAYK